MRVQIDADQKFEWKQILQIMPCPIPMTACFWVEEEVGEVYREPVELLALVQNREHDAEVYTEVEPQIIDLDGSVYCPISDNNFLGYEKHGVKRDWQEEIKRLKQYREQRREKARSRTE